MAKTAAGLVEYAKAQLGRPYWMGTFGQTATQALYASNKIRLPGDYGWTDMPSQIGKRVHDCIGLIKGYIWSDGPNAAPVYCSNGCPDASADSMRAACKEHGTISTIPDVPGVLVFAPGHVGVYIGNGEVIEAMGHKYGVVKTKLKNRTFKWWGKCPYINYKEEAKDMAQAVMHKGYQVDKDLLDEQGRDNKPRWVPEAIKWATDNHIISGDPSGDLQLRGPLTRESFLIMLYKYSQMQ